MSNTVDFKHFLTYDNFLTKKVSYTADNSLYVIYGDDEKAEHPIIGKPDFNFTDLIFISDRKWVWNRGVFYYLTKWDGNNITLDGYSKVQTNLPLDSSDTINLAFAKLESELDGLEERIETIEQII